MLIPLSHLRSFYTTPEAHPDDRGCFHEWFKASEFESFTGFPFDLQQANLSISRAGVIRGLHFAEVPPGQEKFVTCVTGAIWDVIVDIRVGAPTYGVWEAVELSSANRRCLYIPNGYAHGFYAREQSTVVYLTTAEYNPAVEHGCDPFDAKLGIEWPEGEHVLSPKDAHAPALKELRSAGVVPTLSDCEAYIAGMKDAWVMANEEASQ